MKPNKIEILYFDIFHRIFKNYNHNFLIPNYREHLLAIIQANGDIDLIEMYEIMNMPVVELPKDTKPPQPKIWLKIFCCFGTQWQTYSVNF